MVWTRSGPYLYFDEDHGSPSPGFRLGFPTVQEVFFDAKVGKNVYVLITSSGRRVELRQLGTTNTYEAADSSYLQLTYFIDDSSVEHLWLRSTDGTVMAFSRFEDEWRATVIEDRNGNSLTVNYNGYGDITDITDTLGRVINFNYDGNANLRTITQSWNGQTHTWATFWLPNVPVQTGFSGLVVSGVANNEQFPMLTQVALDDGTLYKFDYTNYGQVNYIRRDIPDNVHRSYLAYNYDITSDDCPRITGVRNWAENWNVVNGAATEVLTQYGVEGNAHVLTTPDGTVYKEFYTVSATGPPWQRGLVLQTEVWSGGEQKITTTGWTQDNPSVNYQTNPRVTETNVYDAANNRRRTTVGYQTFTLPDGASCSLPSDVYEYQADATNIARRTHTDYNLDANYLNRRIIGLPQTQLL